VREELLRHLMNLQAIRVDCMGLSGLTVVMDMHTVLPNRLLNVSAIIIAVGTLVLQYNTAPRLRRIATNSDSLSRGEFAHVTNPSVVSCPFTLKVSFNDTGRPCN
jgi:hypothetical protein